jgi:hypothetical protein
MVDFWTKPLTVIPGDVEQTGIDEVEKGSRFTILLPSV